MSGLTYAPAVRRRRNRSSQPNLQAPVEHRPDEIKVLFLAGKGRSGGTILASLLGQLPGFFNAGELNKLWDYVLMPNYQCGCGEPLRSCETWSAILAEADRLYREQTGAPLLSEGVGLAQASVYAGRNSRGFSV